MGLFGGAKDRADEATKPSGKQAMLAELEATCVRLRAMPLQELADHLLRSTFGPGAPGDGQVITLADLMSPYDPTGHHGIFPGLPIELSREVTWLVEEGLQQLERAGLLIVSTTRSGSYIDPTYRLTRAGRREVGSSTA
jgi:hypothetical protein